MSRIRNGIYTRSIENYWESYYRLREADDKKHSYDDEK
jgi:hypothetical protein